MQALIFARKPAKFVEFKIDTETPEIQPFLHLEELAKKIESFRSSRSLKTISRRRVER
jgi:hypothetical protein